MRGIKGYSCRRYHAMQGTHGDHGVPCPWSYGRQLPVNSRAGRDQPQSWGLKCALRGWLVAPSSSASICLRCSSLMRNLPLRSLAPSLPFRSSWKRRGCGAARPCLGRLPVRELINSVSESVPLSGVSKERLTEHVTAGGRRPEDVASGERRQVCQ